MEPLVERRPDNLQYRVWLMHAYFRTGAKQGLLALLDQTDAHFHQEDRWTEDAIGQMAASCLENELYQRSVAYYEELISLYERTHPRRGVGDGTLSGYYASMARAHAGMNDTARAVEAASGAIASWGPRHDKRQEALETLKQVLRQSADLDAYVAELDRRSAQSGLDNPTVRKAIGQVYAEREEHAKAIAQLKLACQLEPNDRQTHQELVACYDRQGDNEGAVGQVLQSLELLRRDIQLYEDLGRRLEALGRAEEFERAYTSVVEALPHESESHALLAEIRQRQDRWPEAVAHWEQVARIRSLEPSGLINLATAQIHLGQWDRAADTLGKLTARSWPPRFGDVEQKAYELRREIDRKRQK